ncbi:hypothetical protein CDAR_304081 [Caerostris darwini]|uniref:Uncharacterized protein n=1 Tax=Caerostris darwini TaxID=1538125 RepID=A0AAV4WD34_9ARAC|nr:hypothetical protein CDAR_304081 [Caerostris darwini]
MATYSIHAKIASVSHKMVKPHNFLGGPSTSVDNWPYACRKEEGFQEKEPWSIASWTPQEVIFGTRLLSTWSSAINALEIRGLDHNFVHLPLLLWHELDLKCWN